MKKSVALLVSSLSIFALCSDAEGINSRTIRERHQAAARAKLAATQPAAKPAERTAERQGLAVDLEEKINADTIYNAIKKLYKELRSIEDEEKQYDVAMKICETIFDNVWESEDANRAWMLRVIKRMQKEGGEVHVKNLDVMLEKVASVIAAGKPAEDEGEEDEAGAEA